MTEKVVYLAVPKKGVHFTRWRNAVKVWLLENHETVTAYVFHSKHVKVWGSTSLASRIPQSRVLAVKDRTLHMDSALLVIGYEAMRRCQEKGYPHETAAAVITHYLFNMGGDGYKDEAAFHRKRARNQPKTTARRDHDWELDELKKAGMI